MEVKNYFAFTAENKPIPFCTAYLYEAGTSNLVTGLTDKNGNPIDNPFQADKDGLVQFAGPNGVYDLRFKSSLRDYRIRVSIVDTPALLEAAATAAEAGSQAAESAASAKRSEEIALDANQIYDSTADALSNGVKTVAITAPGSGGTDGQYIVPVTGTTGSGGQILVVFSGNLLTEAYVLTPGKNYTGSLIADIDSYSGSIGAVVSMTFAPNRGVGKSFKLRSDDSDFIYDEYVVDPGPIATFTGRSVPTGSLVAPQTSTAINRTADGSTYSTRVKYGTHIDASDIGDDTLLHSVGLRVRAASGATHLLLEIFERSLSAAGLNSTAPGEAGADVEVATVEVAIADIGVTAGGGSDVDVVVELEAPIYIKTNHTYGIRYGFIDASDAPVITGTGTLAGDYTSPARAGLWASSNGTVWISNTAATAPLDINIVSTMVTRDAAFQALVEQQSGLSSRVDLVETAVETLEVTQSKVNASFDTADSLILNRAQTAAFAAGNFTRWAVMAAAGVDFTAELPISKLKISGVELDADAVTLHVRRSYRAYDGGDLNDAPGQPADGFIDELEFDVATETTLVAGGSGDTLLDMGDQAAPDNRVLIYEFFAKDGGGNTVNIGFGRADPSGLAQYQRGYYQQGGSWLLIGGTAALSLEIYTEVYSVPASEPAEAADTVMTKNRGCVGIHGYAGRMEYVFDNSVPQSFWCCQAVPAHFDGIRLILGHATTGKAVTVQKAAITVIDDLGDTTAATPFAGSVPVTFGGETSVVIPAASGSKQRSMVRSDFIPISSLPRDDVSGGYPLLSAMAYVPTTGDITLIGNSTGTTDMTSWATHPNYPLIYRHDSGDCVTTPASFTDTTNQSTSIILGVEFLARGRVISFLSSGDSIFNGEGGGISPNGAGFGFLAAQSLNNIDGICYSHLNLAWSGSQTSTFLGRLQSAFEAGVLPDFALLECWSPNDVGSTIEQAEINAMQLRVGQYIELCQRYNVIPVLTTGLPNSLVDYGTTDLLRQAFNDTLREYASRGIVVLDFDAIAREATPDGNGRYGFKAGFSTDTIHPDDSGHAELAALVESGVAALGIVWSGGLISE